MKVLVINIKMKYQIRTILEFPRYQIDTNGQIWKTKGHVPLAGGYDKEGYRRVTLTIKSGIKKTKRIHCLVAKAFIDNPQNLPLVCHNDSNKENNRVENLRWDTQVGNLRDRYLQGTDFNGEQNPAAKLKKEEINLIKQTYKTQHITQEKLGKKFVVCQVHISRILSGDVWKGVGI